MKFYLKTAETKDSDGNEYLDIIMKANDKVFNCAMDLSCFDGKHRAYSSLLSIIETLLDKCYGA